MSQSSGTTNVDDTFQLYDLRVEVICPAGQRIMCGAKAGDYFTLEGAVLPLLAAKQRKTASNDWMSTDAEIACPDPNCPSRLRIVRTGIRTFKHGETTVVPLGPVVEEAPRRSTYSP